MRLPTGVRRRAAAALLAGLFLTPAACEKPARPGPGGPRPAAPAFTLKDARGKSVSLSQFRGKPVFLDFWATWCGPCRMSMPSVQKLSEDYAGKVQVLGMNVDEDPSVVPGFLESMGVSYPTLLVGASGVDGQYQVSGIPAFFAIDAKGRVAGSWLGYDPGYPDVWRKTLDGLLAEK